jgi:hypothetical protein
MSTVQQQTNLVQTIRQELEKHWTGQVVLLLGEHIREPLFIITLTAWAAITASWILDPLLLVASIYLMVSHAVPAWFVQSTYNFFLSVVTGAPDIIVIGGFLSALATWKKNWVVASFQIGLVLILAILTGYAYANIYHLITLSSEQNDQLFFWRSMTGIVYSTAAIILAILDRQEKRETQAAFAPAPAAVVQPVIQPVVNHQEIAQHIIPLLEPAFSQLHSSILQEVRKNGVSSEQIWQSEERILTRLEEQKDEVITACISQLSEHLNSERNTDELLALIEGEIPREIEPEITPVNNEVIYEVIESSIEPETTPKKAQIKEEKKVEDWSDVIEKFPGVNEWLSAGLKSVSIQQIIEVTGFTKNKVGRAKLPVVRGGNKRIENVLNWLRNEPVKKEGNKEEKKTRNTQPLNTEVLDEGITPQKARVTIPLSLDDLPEEFDEDIFDMNPFAAEEIEELELAELSV